jgi:RND family efflux transporter MFP subunit
MLATFLPTTVALAQEQGGGRPPSPVRAATVEKREVGEHRQVTGDLRAVQRSKVASNEEGLVLEYPVTEGQLVEKGDLLARIDARRLQLEMLRLKSQLNVSTAIVTERTAQVGLRQRDYDSLKELSDRGASNPKELADAASELEVAKARKLQAERDVEVLNAAIDLMQTRLDDTVITAPFDGVIVAKHTELGQWLGIGDPVVELVSVGTFEAWLDVPQQYKAAVSRSGVRVSVEVEALKKRYEDISPRVIREVDMSARTFSLVVPLEDAEGLLAAGMSVRGFVPTGKRGEYLLVPRDALLRNEAGFFVYAVMDQPEGPSLAAPRPIRAEFEIGDSVAIRPGAVQPGERVIVEGNERLFPMMPVAVTNAAELARKQDESNSPVASSDSAASPAGGRGDQ